MLEILTSLALYLFLLVVMPAMLAPMWVVAYKVTRNYVLAEPNPPWAVEVLSGLLAWAIVEGYTKTTNPTTAPIALRRMLTLDIAVVSLVGGMVISALLVHFMIYGAILLAIIWFAQPNSY